MSAIPTQIIPAANVRFWFRVIVFIAIISLMAISVLGTFYYLLHKVAPLDLHTMYLDIYYNSQLLYAAVAIQFVLSIIQYGARLYAKEYPKYWLLYSISLAASVSCNMASYLEPLGALVTVYAAAPLIIAADIAPEVLLIKE